MDKQRESFIKNNKKLLDSVNKNLFEAMSFVEKELKDNCKREPDADDDSHMKDVSLSIFNIVIRQASYLIAHMIGGFNEQFVVKKGILKCFDEEITKFLEDQEEGNE